MVSCKGCEKRRVLHKEGDKTVSINVLYKETAGDSPRAGRKEMMNIRKRLLHCGINSDIIFLTIDLCRPNLNIKDVGGGRIAIKN